MECIKTDRAQQAGLQYCPNLERMKHEWTRQKDDSVPFFVKHKSVKYAIDNIGLRLQMLLDYENKGAAEGRDSAHAHNDDGDMSAPSSLRNAVGGAVLGSDRHVLAARIHYGGRDVEGGG